MCDEAPAVFLYAQSTTFGTSKAVQWRARGDDWVQARDVTPVQP